MGNATDKKNLNLKYYAFIFLIVIVFIFSCSMLKNITGSKINITETNPIINIASVMTKESRQIIASYFWLRCDEYFHSTATSLRGNSEIVPLLKIAVIFDPSLVDAYTVLSYHLSTNLDKPKEALETITEAIEKNTDMKTGLPLNTRISELYVQAAFISYFDFHKTSETIILTQNAIKYKTDECDDDTMRFASILHNYLEAHSSGAELNSNTAAIISRADPKGKNKQNNADSYSNKFKDHSDEHDAPFHSAHVCHDDDEHDVKNMTSEEIELHKAEHAYGGQNPWNKPFIVTQLNKLKNFYLLITLIFVTYLTIRRIIVRY